jgi:undecaprenyl-diphosphatase
MERAATRAALWWLLALGTLLAANAWVAASAPGAPPVDRAGLMLAHAWRGPSLDAAFSTLTWLGSLILLLPVAIAAAVLLWRRGDRHEAGFVMVALAGAAAFARGAKYLASRPRPDLFEALAPVASPLSFPSAHAAQATVVAAALVLVLGRCAPRHNRWAMPLLILMVLLVACSRVYLQVHYPSDVLAGSIAAVFWVLGLRALIPNRGILPPP